MESWEKRGDIYQDTQCLMQSVKLIWMPLSNAYKGTLSLVVNLWGSARLIMRKWANNFTVGRVGDKDEWQNLSAYYTPQQTNLPNSLILAHNSFLRKQCLINEMCASVFQTKIVLKVFHRYWWLSKCSEKLVAPKIRKQNGGKKYPGVSAVNL